MDPPTGARSLAGNPVDFSGDASRADVAGTFLERSIAPECLPAIMFLSVAWQLEAQCAVRRPLVPGAERETSDENDYW